LSISPLQARFDDSAGQISTWSGLHGSALALAMLSAARAHRGVTLLVTRSSHQAQLLARDLQLLAVSSLPVLQFPDHETLPYDPFSPHPDIVAERLKTLAALSSLQQGLLLVPVSSLVQRLPPASYILQRSFSIATGQALVIDEFRQRLHHAGYEASDQVYQAGQYTVRGSILDLFPSGSPVPFRLDLFDEEIDSIREFDPESQRSTGKVRQIELLPAREYPADKVSLDEFRRAFRNRFDVDTRKVTLYQDLRSDIHPQGLEQYLPLFFNETSSILDYLPGPPQLVLQDGIYKAAEDQARRTRERWEQRRYDIERPLLDPEELFFSTENLRQRLDEFSTVHLPGPEERRRSAPLFLSEPAPDVRIHERGKSAASELLEFIDTFKGRILFAADTPGRREVLRTTLTAFGVKPRLYETYAAFHGEGTQLGLAVLPVDAGFVIPGELALITESQLFGGRTRPKTQRSVSERDPESIIRNLTDLTAGAPVVHEDHGVGRYLRLKAAKQVRDVAAELLDLYSRRLAREGFAFPLDEKLYAEFASGFPFEETPDQQHAIDAVVSDLTSDKPMDRVVCGDVGFGKTEVALRAAFVAVQAGRQVALLVPTTLLAQQHYSTFTDRLADWPITVALLSRFRTGKQLSQVLSQLANGQADIVIGTHRLIQKDIKFKKLGLVIIDEEQRFGVQQKERLKQLRTEVDLLTLTATPIPRTLNMAMSGIRELSIIATPPARRMAVKTLISEWDKGLLREALQREIQRGGQVFVLHNEVRSIERIAREVQELVPNARLAIAHGQMPERDLEAVMLDFYRQRFNILVCTTIIESGLDVPTANTIVINRADKFGLAQLHQLRGRVGRSHHRAYAYLIVPERRSITPDARKRLEAIASLEELGAGFTLATHDMEIRGAGELLGAEQSGQIHQIGFSLYSDMLARAVDALRQGKEPELHQPVHRGIDIELHVPALIPADYLADVQARLTLYKRIASAKDSAGRLDFGAQGGRVEFSDDTRAEPASLIQLIQDKSLDYRLDGPQKLRILIQEEEPARRFTEAQQLLNRLAPTEH
jgi:transcription-repair coupling factor (superfamily II helicase)